MPELKGLTVQLILATGGMEQGIGMMCALHNFNRLNLLLPRLADMSLFSFLRHHAAILFVLVQADVNILACLELVQQFR